jgi:hypothetical protein
MNQTIRNKQSDNATFCTGKKRRLSDADDKDNSTHDIEVEAKTFLFRSPASPKEIDDIAAKIKSQIDAAQKEIMELGIRAFQKKRGQCSGNGGVDTDDDLMHDEKAREKATALEEAVVRGNPRR